MPRKVLVYTPPEVEGDADEEIAKFTAALSARSAVGDSKGIFLPNFANGAIKLTTVSPEIFYSNDVKSVTVYKVNKPGFFYYQHWRGYWTPSGYTQILACNDSSFSSNVFEIMNSKDTSSGKSNDHVNNMFPFRPGSSTYVMIVSDMNFDKKCLFYVPMFGLSSEQTKTIVTEKIVAVKFPISLDREASLDSEFIKCFK